MHTTAALLPTVFEVDPYVDEVVREFYSNIARLKGRDCGRHCVYIRGLMYEFTPKIINSMFQLPHIPYNLSEHVTDRPNAP
ncbi:unnamed protein product [Arabis nemorensis]|uniref:Uncharacterized protein n=1 Tax=Arabis nemorensis TaxID=586526 RepID=A0A565BSX9_9BRAS|nr:unnamed protein product [Arabis nemorensis]